MEKEKNKVGRPSSYTEEIADEICERLSDGESLRSICKDEHMPSRQTVMNWMESDNNFLTKCARAREAGADVIPDDMEDIELKVLNNTLDPRAASVVLSSMQWRASKLAPKKYGTKILDVTTNGESINNPTTIKLVAGNDNSDDSTTT